MDTFESKRMLPYFLLVWVARIQKIRHKKDAGYGFWFNIEINVHIVVGREAIFKVAAVPYRFVIKFSFDSVYIYWRIL
jgi:hypothetical protein